MLENILLTLILGLMAVMSFVQSAKLAQSHNWSVGKTRFFFAVDAMFALIIAGAIVTINCN